MAAEVMDSLAVRELIVGDVSVYRAGTPKTGTIGISGGKLQLFDGTKWSLVTSS